MIRSPPLCSRGSRPVIFLRGNGHRPDESHFLRPPKLVLEGALFGTFPPQKIARYVWEKETIHRLLQCRTFLAETNGVHRGKISVVDIWVFLGFYSVFVSATGLESFSLRPEKFSKRFSFGGGCVRFFFSGGRFAPPLRIPNYFCLAMLFPKSSLKSGRTKGAAKASCGETVVQKGVFGESVSSLPP